MMMTTMMMIRKSDLKWTARAGEVLQLGLVVVDVCCISFLNFFFSLFFFFFFYYFSFYFFLVISSCFTLLLDLNLLSSAVACIRGVDL